MNKMRFTLTAIALVALCLFATSAAQAQSTRTWVSGVGDDFNPCSRTAPCKTLAGAISKTATHGEIDALDPAGFGTLTITKSITVDGAGTLLGVLSAGGINAFNINITAAGDTDKHVILRNISINGANTGADGIRVLNANDVVVENVVIANITGDGIDVVNSVENSHLYLNNVTIDDVGGHGINLNNTSAGVTRTFLTGKNVRIRDAGDVSTDAGILLGNTARATLVDSEIAGSPGFAVDTTVGSGQAYLENCVLTNNVGGGIRVNTGTTVRISNVDIFQNDGASLGLAGGTVRSFKNNRQDNNVPDNAPNATKDPQ